MSKANIAIVVDSTAYIPQEIVEKYNLHVIPQLLNWEGESLRDNIDITPDEFYGRLSTTKSMPTTSQPSAGEFYEFFQQVAETADAILAVLLSDQLSGTIASARAAADMMGDFPIEIVNSQSTVMGLGFMVLAAAKAIEKGAGLAVAADAARALVPHMNIFFVVDTLEFLHRGGRIGGAQRLIGSMLSIKPLLQLKDGRVEPHSSVRTKKKAINSMLQIASEAMSGKTGVKASVLHASAPDEAQRIYDAVVSRLHPEEIWITPLSPVVGCHVGPGAVGLIYYAEP